MVYSRCVPGTPIARERHLGGTVIKVKFTCTCVSKH